MIYFNLFAIISLFYFKMSKLLKANHALKKWKIYQDDRGILKHTLIEKMNKCNECQEYVEYTFDHKNYTYCSTCIIDKLR